MMKQATKSGAKNVCLEVLVETLVAHNIKKVFGSSAQLSSTLWTCSRCWHRICRCSTWQNAVHIADSYARLTGKTAVAIGQNGPGISNMVTGIATAYLTRSVCVISPQSGSDSIGKLGFKNCNNYRCFPT